MLASTATEDDRSSGLDKTVSEVHDGDSLTSPLPDWIDADWLHQGFFGLEHWQWIGLATTILAGMIVDRIVRGVIHLLLLRLLARHAADSRLRSFLRRMVRPVGLAASGATWLLLLPAISLPAAASSIILPAAHVFITLAMVWAGFRAADFIGEVLADRARQTQNKLDDVLVPLLRKAAKLFVLIFGVVYLADSLHVELAPLLAGLGIGGLGFAFAAKDTLENFFGSITVILDKPFEIGDWIVVGGVEGTVESVGLRSTRIRTFYDSQVTMPNLIVVSNKVDNYGRRRYRRWKENVGVAYDTPPEKIAAFCEGIRELLRIHPYTRKDYYQVWLNSFGDSSLNVLVYVFWKAPDWQTELRERHRFILDIIRLAGQLGVEFAFPTRTLYMRREEDWKEGAKPISANKPGDWMAEAESEGRGIVEDFTAGDDWRSHYPPPYTFSGAKDSAEGGEGGE